MPQRPNSTPPAPQPTSLGVTRARILGIALSLLVHACVALLVVTAGQPQSRPSPTLSRVEIDVVEVQPKPPPPPPPPPEPAPPAPEPKPAPAPPPNPRPKPRPKPAPAPKPTPAPHPPAAEPPPETPPDPRPPPPNSPPPPSAKASAPVRIGISMSSTSAAGGFAAPVGNTLYGASPKIAADPNSVRPYASPDGRYAAPQNGRYVPPARVSTLPKLSREARASYPEAARRAGIEGQVVLRLRVNDKGDVIEARVVESAGHGFDESALAAVKQFKFQPGTLDGAAVMTDITYTYTFLLD